MRLDIPECVHSISNLCLEDAALGFILQYGQLEKNPKKIKKQVLVTEFYPEKCL